MANPIAREENKSGSPMHIKGIPHRIRLARFNLVTSYKKLGFDVNKTCCARGCMSLIGKSKLRELRRFYFLMTGDEQDTYLGSHMQMVSDKTSGDQSVIRVLYLPCATDM